MFKKLQSVFITKSFLFFSLFFIAGLIFIIGLRIWQVQKINGVPFLPQKTDFRLEPPSGSLKGEFIQNSGSVKKLSRNGDDIQPVSPKQDLLQGESLVTETDSASVLEFSGKLQVKLLSGTEINFVNLLPDALLVRQKAGTAVYTLTEANTLSVRSLHVLVSLDSSKARISVDDKNAVLTVEISRGEGKIALTDLENNTHVTNLQKGEKAVIDDEKRVVSIRKSAATF